MFTMEELRKMYPYMSWENMNHLQESVKTINSVLYENILASGIFSYMNTEQKAKLKERVRKIKKDKDETQIKNVQKTTPEPQVASTEGDSKMKDIQEVYRKRVFDELTPVQLDEILLGEIDELNPPIKIGSLEFKASEIIKQLRPEALENNEFLVALFESEEWYESMMNGLDGGYCWLYPPKDENGEYLKYEGVNPENDWSFFRWQGCHRIMRESKIYFLQEYKNILLQENKNDLLQEVKKELQHCLKHDNPIEVEIYSEDKSVRKFLNSNGEFSFRAIETPEPQVVAIEEPQVVETPDYEKKIMTPEDAYYYALNVLKAPFPLGEKAIATDAKYSYFYAKVVLKEPFLLGEKAIATDAKYSYFYAKVVLKEPFLLGEKAIATDSLYSHFYAKVVLKAPFSLGEKAIATDAKYSYFYAKVVLKAPFPQGEKIIATSSNLSYWYAKEVLKAPFPLGEKAIVTDAHLCNIYKKLFPEPQVDKLNSTTMKTDELDGAALDFMVSRCSIYHEYLLENVIPLRYDDDKNDWSPSTNWQQGGVYIHLNNISICYENENQWKSYISVENTSYGSTPLVSSMRCFVKSKFGVTVDIPNWVLGKELVKV